MEEARVYRDRVSRYLHLNPACAQPCRALDTAERQRAIRDCEWSSQGAVIGLRRCPRWPDRRAVLRAFPGSLPEKQQEYARYVEQGLTEELWEPCEAAAAQTIIGNDSLSPRENPPTAFPNSDDPVNSPFVYLFAVRNAQ